MSLRLKPRTLLIPVPKTSQTSQSNSQKFIVAYTTHTGKLPGRQGDHSLCDRIVQLDTVRSKTFQSRSKTLQ